MRIFSYLFSLARGFFVSRLGWITGINIITQGRLKLNGRVVFSGPGRIIAGRNVQLNGTLNSVCTPWTYSKEAVIEIGSDSFLNGTRIGCRNKVVIGNRCIIGDARINDNDGHGIQADRRDIPAEALESSPVILEDNVWVGAAVIILKGVRIGENSVIGAGSVVTKDIPANVVAAGNPCRVIRPINNENRNGNSRAGLRDLH